MTAPQQPKKIRKWHWAVGIFALLVIIGLIVPDKKKSDDSPTTLLDRSTSVTTTTPAWQTTTTYPTTAMPTTTTEYVAPPARTSTYEPTYDPTTHDYMPPARIYDPTTAVEPPRTQEASGGGVSYYPNCSAVRAAGAAPLYRGDPGYSSKLDRDGDGVACE